MGRFWLRSNLFIALVVSALFMGCDNGDLPDAFRLDSFRVLALIADHPEVNPGETVVVTPLLSDINGAGRSIRFSAQVCLDPGVGLGAEPSCSGSSTLQVLAEDQLVTGLASPYFTAPLTSTIAFSVPSAEIAFAGRTDLEKLAGIDFLLTVEFKPDGATSVRSFRRIKISTNPVKNSNPQFEAIPVLVNEAPPGAAPSSAATLRADLQANPDLTVNGSAETLRTSWYVSDGEPSPVITDGEEATEYTPPATAPIGRGILLVTVIRDNRGGISSAITTF